MMRNENVLFPFPNNCLILDLFLHFLCPLVVDGYGLFLVGVCGDVVGDGGGPGQLKEPQHGPRNLLSVQTEVE